jgi:hypothetical protein
MRCVTISDFFDVVVEARLTRKRIICHPKDRFFVT